MRIIKFTGIAGTTVNETTTDTAQTIDAGITDIAFKNSDGVLISSLLVTCITSAVRYCFNAVPVEAGLGHVLAVNDSIEIFGAANIRAFKFISAASGVHGVLSLTPFYGDY